MHTAFGNIDAYTLSLRMRSIEIWIQTILFSLQQRLVFASACKNNLTCIQELDN